MECMNLRLGPKTNDIKQIACTRIFKKKFQRITYTKSSFVDGFCQTDLFKSIFDAD